MFISMNWIRDYVDLSGLDINKLIQQFSLSTAEVENEIFYKGSDLHGVVVAEIKSVEEHPNSKKLHLLKVDIGEEALVDVVCGAPNVRVGMKTAFAKLGAQIGEITTGHYPELCLAWVRSYDPYYTEQVFEPSQNATYRVIRINCPVDVQVRDASGNLVAGFTDDQSTVADGLPAYVNDDGEKLPACGCGVRDPNRLHRGLQCHLRCPGEEL